MEYIQEYKQIGGIQQYLLHYPADEQAPVMLFLHGGPGSAESNFGYLFNQMWQGMFTVVHWDQRGSGKTLQRNPNSQSYPISFDVLQSDIDEIVEYLKQRYNKQKIVILGHSWGTALGAVYTLQNPQQVLMYIAVGQVANMQQNEQTGLQKALELARAANNLKDVKKLESLSVDYPPAAMDKQGTKKISAVRKLQQKYGIAMGLDKQLVSNFIKSPVYCFADVTTMMFKAGKVSAPLLDDLMAFDVKTYGQKYEVPVCCIHGGNDYQTALPLAVDYFEWVQAPQKQIHVIQGAGHNTMIDKPQEFAQALAQAKTMIEG